jgi:hypothetical protein
MASRNLAAGLVGALVLTGATMAPASSTSTSTTAAPQVRRIDRSYADGALGNGLGRLLKQAKNPGSARSHGLKIDQAALAIRDPQGRVLVDLTPEAGVNRAAFRRQAQAAGLSVRATDPVHGTLEGFVPLSSVRALAGLAGTGTIVQAVRPGTDIGRATSQGVALERADKVQAAGVDGSGTTIGALSDSYDTATSTLLGTPLRIHAKNDVKSGDLPGTGNPRYPTPVVVVQDGPTDGSAFDEGRAMLQIAHDVAPGAKLCFATAFGGLIGFADNIRKLADKSGGCGANVIVDDVKYFDEPYFSDSPLSDAIDDVAADGVHYFTSQGNSGQQQGWESKVRLVPASTGLAGTNLDFSTVDPSLYDGGLQDMDPGPGIDVAQSLTLGAGGILDLQWDDPVDVNGAKYGAPVFSATGEITAANPAPAFTFTPTADQVGSTMEFRTDAIPSGSTDLILQVTDPDGKSLGKVDTGTSPEVLATKLAKAGAYTITVTGFRGATGDFTVDVRPVLSPSKTTTDFNLLVFDDEGTFLGALSDLNTLSGRPSELADLSGLPDVQIVISRAGTGSFKATRLRNILNGDLYFTEYVDPLAPATFGHSEARGATSVAAYDPQKPYLPEFFTSPGGKLQVSFNSSGKRYSSPQIRRVPQVAGADGGNTTFFVADDRRDPDTLPNFFGTSASAPHVAAIAALVLDERGGPRSLSPKAMRRLLQRSTYDHDLDPDRSSGTASGLTLGASGPQGYEQDKVPGPMNDAQFFTLTNDGGSPVSSVTLYGETASPTARGKGMVFDTRPFDGEVPYRTDGYPFTVGAASGGLAAADVSATFTAPDGSDEGQFAQITITFRGGLVSGQTVTFGIDRDLQVSGYGGSNEGNGADELGGAISLPGGTGSADGMRFVAALQSGGTVEGRVRNDLGAGWTPLDGYGLVNAEKAVLGR